MKRVFSSHDQVVHLWANQSQTDARCKNVYFEGRSIWSYGRHYELGRLVEINGHTVALINSTGYSVTTSKHINSALHATKHMPRITVTHDFDWKKGLLETQNSLISYLMGTLSGRVFHSPLNRKSYQIQSINDFNNVCASVGMDQLKIEIPKEFLSLLNSHISKCIRKMKRDNSVKQAKREQDRLERIKNGAAEIEAWKQGGPRTEAVRDLEPQIIRVVDDVVETSRGADVPLDHARRLLRLLETRRAKKGVKVGHFTVDKVLKSVVKIGCHDISINQAKEVLKGES